MSTNLPAPAPTSTSTAPAIEWRSTRGLRTALTWLLSADILASVALVVALQHHNSVVDDYHQYRTSYAATQDASRLLGVVALAFVAALLATTVVFIVWTWRSTKNNEALGRIQPRHTSGWSIGGWFIPIGNLWIPAQIMQDLWQGSSLATYGDHEQRTGRRSSLVSWWWGLYLGSRLLTFTPVGWICSVPAAVLAILVVRAVTERQEVALDEQRTRQFATATPGWYADPVERFDHRYWNGSVWTIYASRGGETVVDPLV